MTVALLTKSSIAKNVSVNILLLFFFDKPAWRNLIHKGAIHSENKRYKAARGKRRTRKARADQSANVLSPPPPPSHWWPTCGRGFYARIDRTNPCTDTSPLPLNNPYCYGHT